MRALLLVVVLSLAACGPAPSGLSPEDAHLAYREALLDGDGDRALALLNEAAEAGHLGALQTLADARERGYLTTPYDADRKGMAAHVPIRSFPGQAAAARRAYERARDAAARDGDPNAMRSAAFAVLGADTFIEGRLDADPTPAQVDSATVLYERLLDSDLPRLQLAMLAKAIGRGDAYVRHVDEAAAAGEPMGCTFKIWMTGDQPKRSGTAGVAETMERAIACDPDGAGFEYAVDAVRTLRAEIGRGNEAAVVALDSLHALGVFDRHPRLAALVASAEDA